MVVIPSSLQEHILQILFKGHLGIVKMKAELCLVILNELKY